MKPSRIAIKPISRLSSLATAYHIAAPTTIAAKPNTVARPKRAARDIASGATCWPCSTAVRQLSQSTAPAADQYSSVIARLHPTQVTAVPGTVDGVVKSSGSSPVVMLPRGQWSGSIRANIDR
jgi:hypothetical protein